MVHQLQKNESEKNKMGIHKTSSQKTYNKELWDEILKIGRKKESKGITNNFDDNDIETILATMEFFGASDIWIRQSHWDLKNAKYRLFDWLGMCVMSRNDDAREQNNQALKVLVHSYLKTGGEPKKFIEDLRESDYQIDESWEKVKIDVEVKR